ncbi:MAG: DoxX family protein [Phycisphaeraceae bacterium]|nr:DoxX family protein [Phycisphaeraceae bacterium]MCW5754001.1 DoxX family protein [Phycisphaeraceae bacterium]
MAFRQKLACNVSPILLRLLLALVFLWAGLGKVVEKDFEVTSENARTLVDWGVVSEDDVRHLLPPSAMGAGPSIILAQDTDAPPATGKPVKVQRLYSMSVMLRTVSSPGKFPDDHDRAGQDKMPLAPAFAGKDKTPIYLAWAVALTEIFAGGFMLLGFLTRISALGLVGVMLGAVWLTEIGPAIQSGSTMLGFLPKRDMFSGVWMQLFFQLSMLLGALAVFFSGPGALSLDRLLFGGGRPVTSGDAKGE